MRKIRLYLKYKYLRFIVKHFGPCAFGHKKDGVLMAGNLNCLYQCDRCNKQWTAY